MAYDPAFLVNGSCMLFARKFDAVASPEVGVPLEGVPLEGVAPA